MNEKAKTTNNGLFLKLFKTLTARVLSSQKLLGYALEFLNLMKHCCSCFKHYLKVILSLRKPNISNVVSRASYREMHAQQPIRSGVILIICAIKPSCYIKMRTTYTKRNVSCRFDASMHAWIIKTFTMNEYMAKN